MLGYQQNRVKLGPPRQTGMNGHPTSDHQTFIECLQGVEHYVKMISSHKNCGGWKAL